MFRSMHISALAVDSLTKSPIVLLKEIDGERTLPIWIGLLEANAIAVELEGIQLARPMTQRLARVQLHMKVHLQRSHFLMLGYRCHLGQVNIFFSTALTH